MRIVSLLASATEIAWDLGLGDAIVGISHECDHPPEALDRPRVSRARFDPAGLSSGEIDAALRAAMHDHGDAYEIDRDLLERLAPDLVLTQGVCRVCAVPTVLAEEAVRGLARKPRIVAVDSHSVDDIYRSILDVGSASGVEARARDRVAALRARVGAVSALVRGRPSPRVLALEWLDPPFVPGHWVPEMIALAGGVCLAGEALAPSRRVAWADLSGLDPDVLLVMPCGYDLPRSADDAAAACDRLADTAPRAVRSGRAFVVDGSAYFSRSGPRFATGVEILGALLHPERFPDADLGGKASDWP